MLSLNECSVGSINQVDSPSLLLPLSGRVGSFLVWMAADHRWAIFLDGQHRFHAFDVDDNNSSWQGLLIGGVSIEVDEASVFASGESRMSGSIVRRGDQAFIMPGRDRNSASAILLLGSLPAAGCNLEAGFARWQITLGAGLQKRVLMAIDASVATI